MIESGGPDPDPERTIREILSSAPTSAPRAPIINGDHNFIFIVAGDGHFASIASAGANLSCRSGLADAILVRASELRMDLDQVLALAARKLGRRADSLGDFTRRELINLFSILTRMRRPGLGR